MLEAVSKGVQRLEKIQQHLEHAIKEDRGQNTALEKSNVKKEETCCPFFCFNHSHQFPVVVENEFLDTCWNMEPSQSELDEIVRGPAMIPQSDVFQSPPP